MEIKTKQQLKFCILADRMMNQGVFKFTLKQRLKRILFPSYGDLILDYLSAMRKCSYYRHSPSMLGGGRLLYIINLHRFKQLGIRLGYTLGYDSFGYGLRIPHYGTIVVGAKTRVGNYTCIHTSTCITNTGKIIGDGLYLATGAKITTHLSLAHGVQIGANSVVNKTFSEGNIMIAGAPAVKKKDAIPWYLSEAHKWKFEKIEDLRKRMKVDL